MDNILVRNADLVLYEIGTTNFWLSLCGLKLKAAARRAAGTMNRALIGITPSLMTTEAIKPCLSFKMVAFGIACVFQTGYIVTDRPPFPVEYNTIQKASKTD
ncbi:hypothetical protein [Rhizobium sp. Root1220]|uniref:hypothetical protein n=1 Tax=Rhizobium sp. Root1220 TaxID=1736432 RepID=UPI00138F8D0E|nr:hypothetical protein [Rhizobium sp. Root1220]